MSIGQRALFETAVVNRMKESGFLEIEIRTECLVRCDDGYQDEVINAGWHYWNAAVVAQTPAPNALGRPVGHCDDDQAWRSFSAEYGDRSRADLGKGNMTDFALANAQFMCDRNSLDLIVYQTAAKERIRWLSIQLAAALAASEGSAHG